MKRAFTIWQFLLIIAVLFVIAAILLPIFTRARENERPPICPSNLKNIGLGFQQYLQDYNEKFPIVTSGGAVVGWADALDPYIKSTQVFQCPSEPISEASGRGGNGYTDYWMNSRLSGKSQELLASSALTILNGDGNSTNARYALNSIPAAWKGNSTSPLYRHLEGANYGFTDGHVKWFQAEKVTELNPNNSPEKGFYTFALR